MNSISGAAPRTRAKNIPLPLYRLKLRCLGGEDRGVETQAEEKALKESLREGGVIFKVLSASLV